jgi:peptidoglycan/xylan/chitin deacetylase (PgdA/CDA1 family)
MFRTLFLSALLAAAALPAQAQVAARSPAPTQPRGTSAAPKLAPPAPSLPPNELGRIMVLEYHRIDRPENRWTRTPENFRRDLATLYARGYRVVGLNELLDRRINVPLGLTPVVLTFDDSSAGQFRYVLRDGRLEIDPDCAIGILEAFAERQPDFGRAATFFVLPAADPPNRLFNQPEHVGRKLQYLAGRGFEIGNHTLWHANLGTYPEGVVRSQIAEAQQWIQRHVPAYRIRSIALPHGVYPRHVEWALRGEVKGTAYRHDAILMVAGGAAPSPFAARFDATRLPRIQAVEHDLAYWLGHFERNPRDRFVSDGDPSVVTVPAGNRGGLGLLPGGLRVVERADTLGDQGSASRPSTPAAPPRRNAARGHRERG